jgi:hypothetical protein
MVKLKPDPKSISSANYFSDDTEKAVIKYQDEQDLEIKKKIFSQDIRPAFSKLIENIIYVYKFHLLR